MNAKKSKKKKQATQHKQKILIKTGRGLSYILECRYCARKVPTHLHNQILGKLKEANKAKGKGRFLVCKNCFPRHARERRK